MKSRCYNDFLPVAVDYSNYYKRLIQRGDYILVRGGKIPKEFVKDYKYAKFVLKITGGND